MILHGRHSELWTLTQVDRGLVDDRDIGLALAMQFRAVVEMARVAAGAEESICWLG